VKADGSERYKIQVSPSAILADAWSCFSMEAEFMLFEEAKATCDEIAKRALRASDPLLVQQFAKMFAMLLARVRSTPPSEAMSCVQFVDLLFTSFDEGIDRRSVATCEGSEYGS